MSLMSLIEYLSHAITFNFQSCETGIVSFFFPQGLNPGKAIGEIKKMLATYQGKQAATA